MSRITGLERPLLGLAACLLALAAVGAVWINSFDDPNAGVIPLVQAVPYALSVWLILRGRPDGTDDGRAVITIIAVAIAMRLMLLPGWPVSTDIYRYVWDGRVQGAGINPYLYLPVDPTLASLRDSVIYPYINRAHYAPTIYPPTSQIIFYLITRISEAMLVMKVAMLAFEGLAIWAILRLLAARGLPRARILIYAWHPLPLWEFAHSGHIDIAAIAFLLLALLAVERRSPLLAGVALGAGTLVKYFPVAAAPALYKRWDWRLPVAFLVTVVVLYLPYAGAGGKVLGFLGRYVSEERIDQGSGIFLWQLIGTIVPLRLDALSFYVSAAAVIMAALSLMLMMREPRPGADLGGALLLATASTILFSPHYAWYFAWLVPFLCFVPSIGVIYLTCAASYLYFAHWPPTMAEGLVVYGPCLVLLIVELAWRQRRKMEERHGDAIPA
jgi:alpha-1,6-mannosyltransferase